MPGTCRANPASSRRRMGRKLESYEEPIVVEIPREVACLVSFVLIEAAFIDGRSLRVPNWLTFHFLLGGWIYACWSGGGALLLWSMAGAVVGLMTLLPLYAIGGMGAGDVKLMAGVGAWIGPSLTMGAFLSSVMVGGLMGLAMMAYSGELFRHLAMMQTIGREVLVVRNPAVLSEMASRRKPTMLLLPYGIPIAVGTITFFVWAGFLG
jgi:prepilin peptidase CpaA